MRQERDYSTIVDALRPVLHDLPGKIVAIDGRCGVGKTTLGRYLAYRFNVSLIETDLFLIEQQGGTLYRNDEIGRIITKRLNKPRPVIVEGTTVLRLLSQLNRKPDFTIYVANPDAPKVDGQLLQDIQAYEEQFSPRERADMTVQFTGCD